MNHESITNHFFYSTPQKTGTNHETILVDGGGGTTPPRPVAATTVDHKLWW
jgi:hypothetical protein